MENSFFVQCSKSKKMEGIDFSQLKLYELTMNGKAWMSNASVSFGYDAKTLCENWKAAWRNQFFYFGEGPDGWG